MKIRKAPMKDLIKYFKELYLKGVKNPYQNIFYIIDDYYCSITKRRSIVPAGEAFFEEWCSYNYSNTMKNCPNVPGIIIYRQRGNGSYNYGILYHGGQMEEQDHQTEYLAYFDIDENGIVSSHAYREGDWDGWGAPTRYFFFEPSDYIDNNSWNLGERTLTLDKMGHDVYVFQQLMKKVFPEQKITGYFDKSTLENLHSLQRQNDVPENDFINVKTPAGKKIINSLTYENKYSPVER